MQKPDVSHMLSKIFADFISFVFNLLIALFKSSVILQLFLLHMSENGIDCKTATSIESEALNQEGASQYLL